MFSPSCSWNLCLCLCLCVCVRAHAGAFIHVGACENQKFKANIFPGHSPPCLWRLSFSLLGSATLAGQRASRICLSLASSCSTTDINSCHWLFTWGLRVWTRVRMHSKHFCHWAISPAPEILSFFWSVFLLFQLGTLKNEMKEGLSPKAL